MKLRDLTINGIAVLVLCLATSYASAAESGTKTLKERLSDKASDEQRVDNCGVPPERRGPVPRPDCPAAKAGTAAEAGQGAAADAPSPVEPTVR